MLVLGTVVTAVAALALTGCAPAERTHGALRQRPSPIEHATKSHQHSNTVQHLAKGLISTGWRVTRIVDGDTVDVTKGRRTLTLRLIGIDTPETVHPTEPIECFGPEATAFASRRLLGEPATLEFDPSQGRLDYYGRTLAYVWTTSSGPDLFNRDAVRRGYALEYTYDAAYHWQREFLYAETRAKAARLGVWRCPHPGS